MTSIALIPARQGSKRLPHKNKIDFLGEPIITYTIKAAKNAKRFDRIVVSTDDPDIASIATQCGVEVADRDVALASDDARVVDVCLDFLNQNREVTFLTVLYATAPLRFANDIQAVFDLLGEDTDFAMAVSLCSVPIHQALVREGHQASPVFPQLIHQRANEVTPFYLDNGSTYAVRVSEFLKQKTFYGKRLALYVMPNERSIDIDTAADLALARTQAMVIS